VFNIAKKGIGGGRDFSWGSVYGTMQVLFGYTQVWEEGIDALGRNRQPFPTHQLYQVQITMIGSYYKVALMYPSDSPDFLQLCN